MGILLTGASNARGMKNIVELRRYWMLMVLSDKAVTGGGGVLGVKTPPKLFAIFFS